LFAPNPANAGSKLIFFTPLPGRQAGFRDGADEENQYVFLNHADIH